MSKRKTGRPATNVFYTDHADANQVVDHSYYVSGDGFRITAHAPSPKKRRRVLPENLQDEYAHWIPGEDFNGDQEPTWRNQQWGQETMYTRWTNANST